MSFGGQTLQAMTRDGAPLTFTREVIKGVEYAFFAATGGSYTATYAPDTTAPAISAVNAVAAPDGTATVTWTTDEPSDSRVDYGTTAALVPPGDAGALAQTIKDLLDDPERRARYGAAGRKRVEETFSWHAAAVNTAAAMAEVIAQKQAEMKQENH